MSDFENERNEQLIREREEYERQYFESVIDEMMESDALDKLIADRIKYIDENFDFEPSPEYQRLEQLYYQSYEERFKDDDPFDKFDEHDYPEGPDENINGVKYPPFDEFHDLDDNIIRMEPEISHYEDFDEPDYADVYENLAEDALIELHDKEEAYFDELIRQYIEEEKSYIDNLLVDAIEEDYLFEKAIDNLIMDGIGINYYPDDFEYEQNGHWYDEHYNRPDESVIDHFDGFDEIDYPEDPITFEESHRNQELREHLEQMEIEEAVQRDFEKYKRDKIKRLHDDVPEPEGELILDPPEDGGYVYDDMDEKRNKQLIKDNEKLESLFKDYFTKDDTLDNIIKQKLKEKKFTNNLY